MPDRNDESQAGLSRRRFLALSACSAVVPVVAGLPVSASAADAPAHQRASAATRNTPDVKLVHSVCLACNARCGVRGVIQDGKLTNISGNPYHPYSTGLAPLPMSTPVADSFAAPASVCGKSLNTPAYAYSPHRILRPLKRSGPRGAGQFEPIGWEQLIAELTQGGALFKHLGEERVVAGFKDTLSDEPIDPSDPGLGPKRNGLVLISGRLQSGRQEFIDRFIKGACGSPNHISHTDICGLGFRMGNFALTEGKEVELKADPKHVEFLLVIGANIYEALQPGVNTYAAVLGERRGQGERVAPRIVVADPRATAASAHAEKWLPIKPGTDGAFALALARRMLETGRHNEAFLRIPNRDAALAKGFGSATNATHLVICMPGDPNDGRILRFKDIDPSRDEKSGELPLAIDPQSGAAVPADRLEEAKLEGEIEVKSYFGKIFKTKTAYSLFKASVMSRGLEEYAALCGLPLTDILEVADAFAAHGTKAAVTQYHGAGNYVGGAHAAYAVAALNALVGSVDMRGGYLKGGGGVGAPLKGLYDLESFEGKKKPQGVTISREKAVYEKTAEFKRKKKEGGAGYPSKRPWFSYTRGGLSTEAMSGIDERYPYPCSILVTYLYNGVYSAPGGYRYVSTLQDPAKTPLHVSLDVAINETNLYADYIVPDLTFAEGHYGWLTPHAPGERFTGLRTPMIEPLNEKTPDGRPICTETLLIDLAKALKLPGFGEDAIVDAKGGKHGLKRAEDFYLRAFSNIVEAAKLKGAQSDLDFVNRNYPVAQHLSLLPENEKLAVASALARGGIFLDSESLFKGDAFTRGLPLYALYNEQLGRVKNSMTGKRCPGVPAWVEEGLADGSRLDKLDAEYPFLLVSYKTRLHTQSRSLWYGISMELAPENHIELHPDDAAPLGLKDGDRARLVSASAPKGISGSVKLTKLLRRGCVAASFHYGHTQFGGSRLAVKDAATVFQGGALITDEQGLVPEPRFLSGLNPNDAARLDPSLANTPLVDTLAGIPDFSSTRVKVQKV